MGLRTGLLLVVVVLIAALAALNWDLVMHSGPMSVGVMQVQAPFGFVMLVLTALLTALFAIYLVYLQGTVLLETRRHNKELQTQRDLADKAEASRFTELRGFLETQEQARIQRLGEQQTHLLARIEQLEATVTARADQSDNTTAAHIGQLEDRFDRRGLPTDIPRQS